MLTFHKALRIYAPKVTHGDLITPLLLYLDLYLLSFFLPLSVLLEYSRDLMT